MISGLSLIYIVHVIINLGNNFLIMGDKIVLNFGMKLQH